MSENALIIEKLVTQEAEQQIERLKSNLAALQTQMTELIKKNVEYGNTLTGGVTMKEANRLSKELTANLKQMDSAKKQITATNIEMSRAELILAKANYENAKANRENAKAEEIRARTLKILNGEKEKAEAFAKREQKLADDLTNEYKKQSKQLAELELRFKNLALTKGRDHVETKQALDDANKLKAKLLELDTAVGDHRRNVGNYNMVAANMGHIMRELPNAANGLRTTIMALSNNIVPLAENIADLVKKNKALAAEGKPTESVIKQLGGTVFGITGIISMASTALLMFANSMNDTSDESKELKNDLQGLQDSIQKTYKAIIDGEKAVQDAEDKGENAARRRVAELKARNAGVKEIQDAEQTYADIRKKNLEKEKSLYDDLAKSIDELQFKGAMKNSEEFFNKFKDGLVLSKLTKEQRESILQMQKDVTSGAMSFADMMSGRTKTKLEEIKDYFSKQAVEIKEKIKDIDSETAQSDSQLKEKLRRQREDDAKKRKELQDRSIKSDLSYIAQSSEQNAANHKAIFEDEKRTMDERLDYLVMWVMEKQNAIRAEAEAEKATGEKTATELKNIERKKQDDLTQIGVDAARMRAKAIADAEEQGRKDAEKAQKDRLKENNDSVKSGIDAMKIYYEEAAQTEIMERDATGRRALVIQRKWMATALNDIETQIHALRDMGGVSEDVINNLLKYKQKARKELFKKDTEILKETLTEFKKYSDSVLSGIKSLSGIFSGDTSEIDAQITALERAHQVKLAQINAEATSEEDKNRRIAEAEADLEARRGEMENRKREAAQRKAVADKAAAIFQAIINTAIEVTKVLSQPWLAAAVGFQGAAQIAAIAAAPLPAYKEGTGPDGKPDNRPMVVGDGYRKEYIRTGNGDVYETPAVPTLVENPILTKAGTIVYKDFNEYVASQSAIDGGIGDIRIVPIGMGGVIKLLEKQADTNRTISKSQQQATHYLGLLVNKSPVKVVGNGLESFYNNRRK